MTSTTVITKTSFFDAPREVIWSFLTDKDKLAEWYHPAEKDLAPGEDYNLFRKADDGAHVRQIWGRVIEMAAPDKLVMTFCIDPFGGRETTVTWVLEAAAGGTRLSLTHDGIAEAAGGAALPLLQALDHGWDAHIQRLRDAASDDA